MDTGWILDHLDDLAYRLVQHIWLAGIAIVVGFAISLVLAILAVRRRSTYGPIVAISDILFTIPSVAVFVALVPITGLTTVTVEVPLVMYTLLIFVRNITAGLDSVPEDVLEAADGMGYTRRRRLWQVEFPLALPLVIAGIRLASVSTIGLVTVSGILGDNFGGLGFFIFAGLQPQLLDRALLRGRPLDPAGHRRGRRLRADPEAGDPLGGRSRRQGHLMEIFSQTLTWLTDPAHWNGTGGIANRLLEHIILSNISLAIALAIALPVGLWVGHTGRYATLAVNAANIGRAVPSLAAIAIALPITVAIDPQLGFKVYPTIAGMVVLAVPPILVNAYAGVAGVDRDLVEAGRGMGMRPAQLLLKVELPLAVPVIAAGVRSAAVQIVATATLGAIFGFGGLGRYLIDGYARGDKPQIAGGVVLVASLAITTELALPAAPAPAHAARHQAPAARCSRGAWAQSGAGGRPPLIFKTVARYPTHCCHHLTGIVARPARPPSGSRGSKGGTHAAIPHARPRGVRARAHQRLHDGWG